MSKMSHAPGTPGMHVAMVSATSKPQVHTYVAGHDDVNHVYPYPPNPLTKCTVYSTGKPK